MFKDKISNMERIDIGDYVYVYQYRKRKEIEFFQDLDFIKVTEIVPKNKPSDSIMVGGIKTICNKGILNDENVVGFVDYIRHGDIIQTSEGDKFINYFSSKKEFNKKILDILHPDYSNKELDVVYLDVIKDEKSQEYYESKWQKDDIYIVYELNHNYLNSNCNLLLLEMKLLKGLSQEDIENKTLRYLDYMSAIKFLLNKEY